MFSILFCHSHSVLARSWPQRDHPPGCSVEQADWNADLLPGSLWSTWVEKEKPFFPAVNKPVRFFRKTGPTKTVYSPHFEYYPRREGGEKFQKTWISAIGFFFCDRLLSVHHSQQISDSHVPQFFSICFPFPTGVRPGRGASGGQMYQKQFWRTCLPQKILQN